MYSEKLLRAVLVPILFLCFLFAEAQQVKPQLRISELMADNEKTKKNRQRQFADWVELHNYGKGILSMAGLYLTDDRKEPKKAALPEQLSLMPNGYTFFWLDGSNKQNGLPFKLSADGEFIGLYSEQHGWLDSLTFGPQLPDVSFGRNERGDWGYYKKPTPAKPNSSKQFIAQQLPPIFSVQGGFFNKAQSLKLKAKKKARIFYTVDGKTPTKENGILYEKPIEIDSTTIIRARAFRKDHLPSNVVSHSYFFDVNHQFPVVSIATDDEVLFTSTDPKLNIYKEKTVGVAYFDEQQQSIFNTQAGMRLVGKAIRNYPQKSIAIHFRDNLGIRSINYQLFPEKPEQKYFAFLLRNSGNDWGKTMFKDAMMHRLIINGTDIDYQGYKPVVVYLNGKYQGIHNLREKICSHYMETNHQVDGDNIDLIEFSSLPTKGTMDHWKHMNDFIRNADMTKAANYDSVLQWIDVGNFIDYQATEIFYANCDWPMANMKYWRPATKDGKWRWILFDTDLGFDLNKRRVKGHHNTMDYAMGENNCHLPHLTNALTESTIILRGLMQNEDFRERFLSRFADLMNTNFSAQTITDTISNMQKRLEPEIDAHIKQWGGKGGIPNREAWQQEINKLLAFGKERADTMRYMLDKEFDLGGVKKLTIHVNGKGKVQVNSIEPRAYPFTGNYFGNIPVLLRAIPNEGSSFKGWEGTKGKKEELSLKLREAMKITAVFE